MARKGNRNKRGRKRGNTSNTDDKKVRPDVILKKDSFSPIERRILSAHHQQLAQQLATAERDLASVYSSDAEKARAIERKEALEPRLGEVKDKLDADLLAKDAARAAKREARRKAAFEARQARQANEARHAASRVEITHHLTSMEKFKAELAEAGGKVAKVKGVTWIVFPHGERIQGIIDFHVCDGLVVAGLELANDQDESTIHISSDGKKVAFPVELDESSDEVTIVPYNWETHLVIDDIMDPEFVAPEIDALPHNDGGAGVSGFTDLTPVSDMSSDSRSDSGSDSDSSTDYVSAPVPAQLSLGIATLAAMGTGSSTDFTQVVVGALGTDDTIVGKAKTPAQRARQQRKNQKRRAMGKGRGRSGAPAGVTSYFE
jgi:hypothetical protein